MKSSYCPRCRTETIYSPENPWRPFCSDRCKLIDLGQWANEDYKVPLQEQPDETDFPVPSDPEESPEG